VSQIKEKFGGLRFYAYGLPERGGEIIQKYEERALITCERCGSIDNVQLHNDRWLKTLCDPCATEWLQNRKSNRADRNQIDKQKLE